MAQTPWGKRTMGCCCEKDNRCRIYAPCCIRGMTFEASFFVIDGDLETGPLGNAVVSRMTLANNCAAQTSVDWSTFEQLDNDRANGQVKVGMGGVPGGGCTFGIDVSLQDLFCDCESAAGNNFTVEIEVCNDNIKHKVDGTGAIAVEMRQPSLAVWFTDSKEQVCIIELLSSATDVVHNLMFGQRHTFVIKFGTADHNDSGCFTECYNSDEDVLIAPAGYIEDGYPSTCITKVPCAKGTGTIFPVYAPAISCADSACPPCGCILDRLGGCACGCLGIEPLAACAAPKKVASGSESNGRGTICASTETGHGVGNDTIMQCRDSNCLLTAEVRAPLVGSARWSFTRWEVGNPVVKTCGCAVDEIAAGIFPLPSCEGYLVTWGGNTNMSVDSGGILPGSTSCNNPRTGGT